MNPLAFIALMFLGLVFMGIGAVIYTLWITR